MATLTEQLLTPMAGFEGSAEDLKIMLENEMMETRRYLEEREQKKNSKTLEEQADDIRRKFKKSQNLYEEFDPAKFESKVRVDLLFFEHLCQGLPEVDRMHDLISQYYQTIQQLHEIVNIKAESHKMLKTSLLNESYEDQQKIFSKILSEHINNNYYRFSKEKRTERFLEESKEYSGMLMEKGMPSSDAIQMAIKASVLESLLENVAIPKFAQRRIKFLCEDKDYGLVFDQKKLVSLWESFRWQSKRLARVLSAAV